MRLVIALSLCLLAGCALPANPRTEIGYGAISGFHLMNSKDVTIKAKKIGYQGGEFIAEDLELVDEASAVRRANVEQMTAYTEQIKAMGTAVEAVSRVAASVVPYAVAARAAQPSTSLGFNPATGAVSIDRTAATITPEQWAAIAAAAEAMRAPTGGVGSVSPSAPVVTSAPSVIIPTATQPTLIPAVPPSAGAVASPPISAADKAALIELLRREKAALVAASDRPTARELEIDELLAVLGAR